MEYIVQQSNLSEVATMLCCDCGIEIVPNSSNTCVTCLRNKIDISENIPKQCTLYFCRNCERYLQPPSSWVHANLESKELLSLCLKKIKGIDKDVQLVDAGFLWTEPHSKRIKIKVVIQKEVVVGAILQQTFSVEYVVHNQMCEECHRVEAKDYWRACVQVRQKAQHKKTLYYMEQVILKHRAHANSTSIKQVHEGLDFFYQQQQDARKLVDFLQSIVPCRTSNAKELISHDPRSNIYNYKHTYLVELVPLCKDDIVCLPLQIARQLGNIGQICVVTQITQFIYLIDPNTCRTSVLRAEVYWRDPFISISCPKYFSEFIVMNIEINQHNMNKDNRKGQGAESRKHIGAGVWVVRASELGCDDHQYHCRTHLGHLLKHGDSVLGFDLLNANVNNDHLEKMEQHQLPDVILIKKIFGSSSNRARKRMWKLNHLDREEENQTHSTDNDYNDFLEDLEENKTIRQHINIFKDTGKICVHVENEDEDDDVPGISLTEMINELNLNEDATGEEGASMLQ